MHTGIPEEKRPDYFDRLQELIGCGSLELIQEDGKCRLVYLMNDAAESFLVFEEAVVTGFCDKKIMDNHAVLDLYKEGYILSVNQGGENAFTIRFRNMSFEIKLYDYGDIGHFWIEDDEDLRWLNYRWLLWLILSLFTFSLVCQSSFSRLAGPEQRKKRQQPR